MKHTIAVFAVVALLGAWRLQAQDAPASAGAPAEECLSRLKQLQLALSLYQKDYDERLPPADKWSDALALYTKGSPGEKRGAEQIAAFHCPLLGQGGWGYSMNWKLSKRRLAEVEAPAGTVALYETNVPRPNANYDGRDLMLRHAMPGAAGKSEVGGNFAFADGHVGWLSAAQRPNFRIFLNNKPR